MVFRDDTIFRHVNTDISRYIQGNEVVSLAISMKMILFGSRHLSYVKVPVRRAVRAAG